MKKDFIKIFIQAILTGILTGILVVLFRFGIENIFSFIKTFCYPHPLIFLAVTTLGGLISGLLVFKLAPETSGSGIPYVKAALLRSGKLIRIRTIFVKFFAGVIGIGTGLSLGREGPSVQIGAGAGSFIGRIFNLKGNNRDKLIASGAGAAIGATFNAPIAGTVFVLEELIHKFTPSMLFPALVATVTAASIARHFIGINPAFNISLSHIEINLNISILCIVLGLFCGISGVLFSKTIFLFNRFYSKITIPDYTKPAFAGLLTGLIGLALPYILSSGNGTVEMLLENKFPITMVLIIFLAKFIITPLCFGSGAAGGIFLPMLMLGSFLGYITGYLGNSLGGDFNLLAISSLGMAGFLASVARTPITAVVMVFEMTGGYDCILPLMLVAAVADLTAEGFNHKPIYAQLVVNQYKTSSSVHLPENIKIKDIMKNVKCFKNNTPISEILDYMNKEHHSAYPIIDKHERLSGIITKSDIEDALIDTKMKSANASRVLDTNPVTVYPEDNLYTAYYRLHSGSTEWAIVVDKEKKVLGIVTRVDLFSI